jgi:hypothetical protein
MQRLVSQLLLALFLFSVPRFSQTDNRCKLKFKGSSREFVKMRSPNRTYPKFKDGDVCTNTMLAGCSATNESVWTAFDQWICFTITMGLAHR